MSTEIAETIGAGSSLSRVPHREHHVQPHFEYTEKDDAHQLRVWMPGVSRDGVEVSLVENHLTVHGHRCDQVPESWQPIFREIGAFDFRLKVRLNVSVAYERIEAQATDGILTLTLPLREEARPRVIEIN